MRTARSFNRATRSDQLLGEGVAGAGCCLLVARGLWGPLVPLARPEAVGVAEVAALPGDRRPPMPGRIIPGPPWKRPKPGPWRTSWWLRSQARAAPPRPPRMTATSADHDHGRQRPGPVAEARAGSARRPAHRQRAAGSSAGPVPVPRAPRRPAAGSARSRHAPVGRAHSRPHGASDSCARPVSGESGSRPWPSPSQETHRDRTDPGTHRSFHSGAMKNTGPELTRAGRYAAARARRRRRGEHRRAAADGAALRGLGRRGRADRQQGRRDREAPAARRRRARHDAARLRRHGGAQAAAHRPARRTRALPDRPRLRRGPRRRPDRGR